METNFKLIFAQEGREVPKAALESSGGVKVELQFGYDVCDFIDLGGNKAPYKKHDYTNFKFDVNDIKNALRLTKMFFAFGSSRRDGFSQDLLEAYMSANKLLVPRISYEYVLPDDVIELMAKLSIEDHGEYDILKGAPELNREITLQMKQIDTFMVMKDTKKVSTIYHCDNLCDIVFSSIHHILKCGFTFKSCKNCSKKFVPYINKNEDFCDRLSPQYPDKTCKEANILIKSTSRIKNDEVQKLQKRVYNLYRSAINFGYSDEAKLDKYMKDKNIWIENLKKGIKTREEYIDWLKTHYARKYST